MRVREVQRMVEGEEVVDGAGVRLRRTLGTAALDHLDPFLLLDEFRSDDPDDYLPGFPDHPHRGFETVTYILAGSMRHRDHKGNEGNLTSGSVQWMTAGRGIVHSEMPRQEEGLLWGFQLWVNLPAALKFTEPRYQDIPADRIPRLERDGVQIRLIAGESGGVEGAVRGIATAPLYADLALPPDGRFSQPVPAGHHAFVYPFEGEVTVGGGGPVRRGTLAVLGDGDEVSLGGGTAGARVLLVAGRPLREPMVRRGPFVMNTAEQILEAIHDFHTGRLQA